MSDSSFNSLNCPACSRVMVPLTVAGVTVDVCRDGCGGNWFDHFELGKFDEPDEPIHPEMMVAPDEVLVRVDDSFKRRCPRCPDIVMRRHLFCARSTVVVDECPGCGGYWLDAGELERIRSEFPNAKARREARAKFVDNLSRLHVEENKSPKLDHMQRARTLDGLLRLAGSRYRIS